jgi:hypothetical protein
MASAWGLAVLLTAAAPGAAPEPTFESHWQDGRAEVAGYRYHVTRYGERREGTCVLVTVTEPFSDAKRVKVDDPRANPADTFEALKLNVIRDFRTGIYDYNTMVSLFTRSRDFAPVKVTFSSAEWCGHVYAEQIFGTREITGHVDSYFEGESRPIRIPLRSGGVVEDDLFILLRGLRGAYLRAGTVRSLPFLPSPFVTRLTHRPAEWTGARIERARAPERLTVPAGRFQADRYTVRVADDRVGAFWIESAHPHRVLKWSWTRASARASRRGEEGLDGGELLRSERLPYWRLNRNGDERHLRDIGLPR